MVISETPTVNPCLRGDKVATSRSDRPDVNLVTAQFCTEPFVPAASPFIILCLHLTQVLVHLPVPM